MLKRFMENNKILRFYYRYASQARLKNDADSGNDYRIATLSKIYLSDTNSRKASL